MMFRRGIASNAAGSTMWMSSMARKGEQQLSEMQARAV
jgi:hypothetical protein